jgi:hypothetical protein
MSSPDQSETYGDDDDQPVSERRRQTKTDESDIVRSTDIVLQTPYSKSTPHCTVQSVSMYVVCLILARPDEILCDASSMGAAYDSKERHPAPKCLSGTCEDVIAKIFEWIRDSGGRPIFWLSGAPGAGKSALAGTIAELCAKQRLLGASFFFSRDRADRRNLDRFLPTIAHQLISLFPSLSTFIRLKDSVPRPLGDQIRTLLVDPFTRLSPGWGLYRSTVVVIDALDECADNNLVDELIQLLATMPNNFPLRFLFTSRPEPHIREAFARLSVDSKTRLLALHDFDAQSSIQMFLRSGFADIYQKHNSTMHAVPRPWPSDGDIQTLVGMSSGLFTFASTLLKFVDGKEVNPSHRLQAFLDLDRGSSTLEFAGLDQLYRQIFAASSYTPRTRSVFGTIALLFDPLPLAEIECLLGLKSGEGWQSLRGLYFIFHISHEQNRPIQIFHASLYDFLTSSDRSAQYFVNPTIHHRFIADNCLYRMAVDLKRDRGAIEDPLTPNHDAGKRSFGRQRISVALRYACCHWASHLTFASCDRAILNNLKMFGFTLILYWIEALSITGDLKMAVPSLEKVKAWLLVGPFLLSDGVCIH